MQVRAKMKCTTITKSGDAKHPTVRVELGAVYSNDPESENRSFASATPSASVSISIDAGRPAAQAFELGGEYYVDFIPVGVPERQYIKDSIWYAVTGDIVISARDGSNATSAKWDSEKRRVTVGEVEYSDMDRLLKDGFSHWRYPRDGE